MLYGQCMVYGVPGTRCLGGHMMLSDGVKIQLVPDRGGQSRRLPWHDTGVKWR